MTSTEDYLLLIIAWIWVLGGVVMFVLANESRPERARSPIALLSFALWPAAIPLMMAYFIILSFIEGNS